MSNLPQQNTINQYDADGTTVAYNYDFLVPTAEDIGVYITLSGQPANPAIDIQTLNVDYTISGVGEQNGGTITFISGAPPSGSTVTLARNMQFSLDTQFADARTFNGQNLDDALERIELQLQQVQSYVMDRCLSYAINEYVPDLPNNVLMPSLGTGQIWMGQNGDVIAVTLEQNPDASTLRSELAQNSNATTSGATLIGYFDSINALATNVQAFLDNLPTYIENVVNEIIPDDPFETGDIKYSFNSTNSLGWILWADTYTVGNASSDATYASASTQQLFELLWNGCTDDVCPVSSGRGMTAADDYADNKTLQLPSTNGRTLVNLSGTYALGAPQGASTVTLSIGNIPAHNHGFTYNVPGTSKGGSSGGGIAVWESTYSGTLSGTTASVGSGSAFNIIPPSTPVYIYIKL